MAKKKKAQAKKGTHSRSSKAVGVGKCQVRLVDWYSPGLVVVLCEEADHDHKQIVFGREECQWLRSLGPMDQSTMRKIIDIKMTFEGSFLQRPELAGFGSPSQGNGSSGSPSSPTSSSETSSSPAREGKQGGLYQPRSKDRPPSSDSSPDSPPSPAPPEESDSTDTEESAKPKETPSGSASEFFGDL